MASQPVPTRTTPPKSPSPPAAKSQQLDPAIEVGNDIEDDTFETGSDPGYGTDGGSTYTASITSSIRQHVYEGGLRYHAFRDGQYAFPNDETEQNREDMKHAVVLLQCDQKHHFAPIAPNPLNIIDLGTGTGIWAIEMAEKYPSAAVLGVDLSPIQPTWVPPNLKFVIDDIEDVWLYPRDHFDLIHLRHVIHSIKNRPLFLQRALRHLKPGGYMEFQEMNYTPLCDDDSITGPYVFRQFMEGMRDGMSALGNDLNSGTKLVKELDEVGFSGVIEKRIKCPIGIWPKDPTLKLAGLYWRTAIIDGLNGLASRAYGRGLQWSKEEIEVFLVDVRKSLMDSSKHAYFTLHMVYAQKPPL